MCFPADEGATTAADAWLRRTGIIVRPVGACRLTDRPRVTIGTATGMHAVAEACGEFVEHEGSRH